MKQIIQLLIAIDQLINTLLGGWADESISARAYRLRNSKIWKYVYRIINIIFFWQKDHCEGSFLSECERRQLPPPYRNNN